MTIKKRKTKNLKKSVKSKIKSIPDKTKSSKVSNSFKTAQDSQNHRSTNTKPKISEALAIVALILNILILPGLGSLIGGRTKAGVWQLVLLLIGLPLSLILVGIPIIIAAWIWGIVTGIRIVQESQ